jgi:DnaJ like chaperone protein
MGIIGKIVGGTIGFALGGPLGAVTGAVFGHAFDHSNLAFDQEVHNPLSSLESSQLAFFVGTFSMLAKLVTSDGDVSETEIRAIESFAVHDLKLSSKNREVAYKIFHTALNSPASFEDFAGQFVEHFRHQPQMLETMIDILIRVSVSDGRMTVAEEALIFNAVRIFNLPDDRFELLKSRYLQTSDRAYSTLGVKRTDTDEEIKRHYRKLAHTYHPDKIASKGLPDEFNQLAQDKFREIQMAYEDIKKERGI